MSKLTFHKRNTIKYNEEINSLDYYKCTIEEVYKDK